jgi:hypothetical protein
MDDDLVTIGTKHGVYPIHAHWLDTPTQCLLRWIRAGSQKAPNSGPYVYTLTGRKVIPAGARDYVGDLDQAA